MSKVFWKEYEKVGKLSEEVHEKIIRQIFPEATDEQVGFIIRKYSSYNPCSYWSWCVINSFTAGDEDSYDPYSRRAKEIINDPNPLGRATSYELMLGIIVADDWCYRRAIEDHEYAMESWKEKIASERREFERTLKAWVGLFVKDKSVSEHYYRVISHAHVLYQVGKNFLRKSFLKICWDNHFVRIRTS